MRAGGQGTGFRTGNLNFPPGDFFRSFYRIVPGKLEQQSIFVEPGVFHFHKLRFGLSVPQIHFRPFGQRLREIGEELGCNLSSQAASFGDAGDGEPVFLHNRQGRGFAAPSFVYWERVVGAGQSYSKISSV